MKIAEGKKISSLYSNFLADKIDASIIPSEINTRVFENSARTLTGSSIIDSESMRNQVVVQKLPRNMYDYNLEIAGAKIVEIGNKSETTQKDLANALNERTAAVAFFSPRSQAWMQYHRKD